ncbi:hypothetical protein BCR34DRAFT_596320 [Clohesyomyces aquaticus]|uniref:Uncharacterized protein n=1 Tax=Clohesyomyces aquaticus TaxID=1231657 RepID=A0A1Y2A7B4_9PLEO|nr:hypothetical protein BCR34DRAFT_596320 [Clohesyomyces aquaticus]
MDRDNPSPIPRSQHPGHDPANRPAEHHPVSQLGQTVDQFGSRQVGLSHISGPISSPAVTGPGQESREPPFRGRPCAPYGVFMDARQLAAHHRLYTNVQVPMGMKNEQGSCYMGYAEYFPSGLGGGTCDLNHNEDMAVNPEDEQKQIDYEQVPRLNPRFARSTATATHQQALSYFYSTPPGKPLEQNNGNLPRGAHQLQQFEQRVPHHSPATLRRLTEDRPTPRYAPNIPMVGLARAAELKHRLPDQSFEARRADKVAGTVELQGKPSVNVPLWKVPKWVQLLDSLYFPESGSDLNVPNSARHTRRGLSRPETPNEGNKDGDSPSTGRLLNPGEFAAEPLEAIRFRSKITSKPGISPTADRTIIEVMRNSHHWVKQMFHAFQNTEGCRDKEGSPDMAKFSPEKFGDIKLAVEAVCWEIFLALISRVTRGFRQGTRSRDESKHYSKGEGDRFDMNCTCLERITKVVDGLKYDKRICRDVFDSFDKVEDFVHAPWYYAKVKKGNQANNQKRAERLQKAMGMSDSAASPIIKAQPVVKQESHRPSLQSRAQSHASPSPVPSTLDDSEIPDPTTAPDQSPDQPSNLTLAPDQSHPADRKRVLEDGLHNDDDDAPAPIKRAKFANESRLTSELPKTECADSNSVVPAEQNEDMEE